MGVVSARPKFFFFLESSASEKRKAAQRKARLGVQGGANEHPPARRHDAGEIRAGMRWARRRAGATHTCGAVRPFLASVLSADPRKSGVATSRGHCFRNTRVGPVPRRPPELPLLSARSISADHRGGPHQTSMRAPAARPVVSNDERAAAATAGICRLALEGPIGRGRQKFMCALPPAIQQGKLTP
jgi:hypothetical protein